MPIILETFMGVNKKIINAAYVSENGIEFKSRLELSFYKELKSRHLNPKYEALTITLISKQYIDSIIIEDGVQKIGVLRPITYTPDFLVSIGNFKIIIEAKGFENDIFPIKKKLFIEWLANRPNFIYIIAHNKRDFVKSLDKVIAMIHEINSLVSVKEDPLNNAINTIFGTKRSKEVTTFIDSITDKPAEYVMVEVFKTIRSDISRDFRVKLMKLSNYLNTWNLEI